MSLSVLSVAYPFAPVGPDTAGGAEQILSLLDAALISEGHNSVVIACEGSRVSGTLATVPLDGGLLDGAARAAAHERYRRAISDALERRSFDVIHMHGFDFREYLPPPGPPVLVTLHLPPEWYPPEALRPSRPGTWLQCVSAAQQRNCPPAPALLPYIENGVPAERFRTAVRKRGYALAMGRVCLEKGFHLALDAAAEAGCPLLVAGEVFPYREHEEYFRRELQPRMDGRARRFIGPVGGGRKRRLLAGARCVLAPSLANETSSLVAMEALASGTPVIAFPAGALPEIIEDGRTGFIVENAHEMAEAIRRAGSIDPEVCRRAARERFPAERMTGQHLRRYEALAGAAVAQRAEVIGYPAA